MIFRRGYRVDLRRCENTHTHFAGSERLATGHEHQRLFVRREHRTERAVDTGHVVRNRELFDERFGICVRADRHQDHIHRLTGTNPVGFRRVVRGRVLEKNIQGLRVGVNVIGKLIYVMFGGFQHKVRIVRRYCHRGVERHQVERVHVGTGLDHGKPACRNHQLVCVLVFDQGHVRVQLIRGG